MISKTEQFYATVQLTQGGNIPWNELDPNEQLMFVQAINVFGQTYEFPEMQHFAQNAQDYMEVLCSQRK